eukprot:5595349-Pyramimonas_sp.AAC.1
MITARFDCKIEFELWRSKGFDRQTRIEFGGCRQIEFDFGGRSMLALGSASSLTLSGREGRVA